MESKLKLKVDSLVRYSSLFVNNSNSNEERNTDNFNITLPEEKNVINMMKSVKIILLTGEAGDGKSRMLKNIREYITKYNFKCIEDFSEEKESEKIRIINTIDEILNSKCDEKYIVAANIGVFAKYVLSKDSTLTLEKLRESPLCKIINFEKRNLAQNAKVFHEIASHFYGTEVLECDNLKCIKHINCPFKENMSELQKYDVVENIRVLCDSVYLIGGHITFRELLSLFSSLATGGCDCDKLCQNIDYDIRYYNIFEKSDGVVLDKISPLDPAKVTEGSDKDLKLFNKCKKDINLYKSEKRRIFFNQGIENKYEKLSAKYLSEFRNVIQLLNNNPYYFDIAEQNSTFIDIKEGFVRLISPEKTDLEISFFDLPSPIEKRIKTKFSINFNELMLVWNHPNFNFALEQNYDEESSINYFCLSGVYASSEGNICSYSLKIDYTLFKYIYKAKDNFFFTASSKVFHEYGLFDFFRKILRLNPKSYDRIEIVFDNEDNMMDFELSFYNPKPILGAKIRKRIKIKKLLGGE